MRATRDLSDHCIVDHFNGVTPPPPKTPLWLIRMTLLLTDRTMHFTGMRGGLWRLLGIDRSPKNPNICNI